MFRATFHPLSPPLAERGGGLRLWPTIQRLDRLSATATTIEQFFREGWSAKDIRASIEGPLNRAIWFTGRPSVLSGVVAACQPRFGNATLQVGPIRASWKSPRLAFVPITPSLINYAAGSRRWGRIDTVETSFLPSCFVFSNFYFEI